MPDNKMYFELDAEDGQLKISYEAVAQMAVDACMSYEGVYEMSAADGNGSDAWNGVKGVSIAKDEAGGCRLKLYISVVYGSNIVETAKNAQERVKAAVESAAGLDVTSVDIYVAGVSFPKE